MSVKPSIAAVTQDIEIGCNVQIAPLWRAARGREKTCGFLIFLKAMIEPRGAGFPHTQACALQEAYRNKTHGQGKVSDPQS